MYWDLNLFAIHPHKTQIKMAKFMAKTVKCESKIIKGMIQHSKQI